MQAQKDSDFYTVHVQCMRGSKKTKQITAGGMVRVFIFFAKIVYFDYN